MFFILWFIHKIALSTSKSYGFGCCFRSHMQTSGECIFFIKLVKYFYRASDLVDIEIGFIFLMSYFQQHLRKSDFSKPLRVVRSGVNPLQL